jgi:hypothetical protein
MYDKVFHHQVANPHASWKSFKEQLYNDILKETPLCYLLCQWLQNLVLPVPFEPSAALSAH